MMTRRGAAALVGLGLIASCGGQDRPVFGGGYRKNTKERHDLVLESKMALETMLLTPWTPINMIRGKRNKYENILQREKS